MPGLMMPAFSKAILASVSPRKSMWSMEMLVIAVATGRSTTLVASNRPPSPTSSTSRSAGTVANRWKATAVVTSNTVIGAPALTRSTCSSASDSASSVTNSPASRMRSWKRTRWGEV
jgi:hypothetical protein